MPLTDEAIASAAGAVLDGASEETFAGTLASMAAAFRSLLGPVCALGFSYAPSEILPSRPALALPRIDFRKQSLWGSEPHVLEFMLRNYPHYVALDPVPPLAAVETHRVHNLTWNLHGNGAYEVDFLARLGIAHELVVGLETFAEQGTALIVFRGPGAARFTTTEARAAAVLIDHVLLALRAQGLRQQLSALVRDGPGGPLGAVVLSRQGELLRTEGAAGQLISSLALPEPVWSRWLVQQARELTCAPRTRTPEERLVALPRLDGGWVQVRLSRLDGAEPEVLALLRRLRPGTQEYFEAAAGDARLTGREREVASLAIQGLSDREIALELGIQPRTVGAHLMQVYARLGVSDRHALRTLLLGPR